MAACTGDSGKQAAGAAGLDLLQLKADYFGIATAFVELYQNKQPGYRNS
ncbi:hypothetical protein [Pontibacter liquoris]|nr:hypothetical protein [Pontibacter liquoris]